MAGRTVSTCDVVAEKPFKNRPGIFHEWIDDLYTTQAAMALFQANCSAAGDQEHHAFTAAADLAVVKVDSNDF